MRVVLRTPTAIVVEDRAVALRIFGAGLLLFAVFLGFLASGEGVGGGAVFPIVLGMVLVGGGIAAIVLPATMLFAFDRDQKQLIVTQRKLTGTFQRRIPLEEVAGVELERSTTMSKGSRSDTWRVVTVLTDGRREPWRSWYDSGYTGKAKIVAEVREFLGAESAVAGAPMVYSPAESRLERKHIGFLMAFCSIFLVVGVSLFVSEQRKLTLYQPVEAQVLDTEIEYRSDSDGDGTWLPVVHYRYEVGGEQFQASRVTPLNESSSRRRAERIIGDFPVGATVTAYYDPDSPDEAYLIKRRSIVPYAFILIPGLAMVVLATGLRRLRTGA